MCVGVLSETVKFILLIAFNENAKFIAVFERCLLHKHFSCMQTKHRHLQHFKTKSLQEKTTGVKNTKILTGCYGCSEDGLIVCLSPLCIAVWTFTHFAVLSLGVFMFFGTVVDSVNLMYTVFSIF